MLPCSPTPQLRTLRKDVAELLRAGKVDNARIRVEAVLREESLLRAYDGECRISPLRTRLARGWHGQAREATRLA